VAYFNLKLSYTQFKTDDFKRDAWKGKNNNFSEYQNTDNMNAQ